MSSTLNDKNLSSLAGDGQEEDDKLLVTDLLRELMPLGLAQWETRVESARINEQAFHGFTTRRDYDELPGFGICTKNVLRNLVNGVSSRVVQGHAVHKAYPTHAEGMDVKAADFANQFLDNFRSKQEFFERDYEFSQNAQLHGAAFWKTVFDPSKGKLVSKPKMNELKLPEIGEDGKPVMEDLGREGEVSTMVATVFEISFGPGHRTDDAEWMLHRLVVSEDQARGYLAESGHGMDSLTSPVDYESSSGAMAKGYHLWEIWYRPGVRFPKGVFAKVLGSTVVLESSDYPYAHGELPISVWHPDYVRDSCFGTSHVDDNIKLQRELNYVEEKKNEIMRTAAGVLLCLPDDLIDQVKNGNYMLEVTDTNQIALIQYKMLDRMPPLLDQRSDELEAAMYTIAGINEILAGSANIKAGTSAKSYEFLGRTDKAKLAAAIARFRGSTFRRDRQALSLFQQFATHEVMMTTFGPNAEPFTSQFKGIDLDGTVLIMEPVEGADTMRSTASAGAPERAQMGLVKPGDVSELARTGLQGTVQGDLMRGQMQELLQRAMVDGDDTAQPDQSIDPLLALDEISMWITRDDVNVLRLQQWGQVYQQMLTQQQQPPQGQVQ